MFKIGLVGCGGVSSMHLDGIERHPERAKVVAVCDPDADRRAAAQQRYDIPKGFSTVPEMIAGADWDAAIVCTPTSVRESVVTALAAAGKPTLVEKPLASSLSEARGMVEEFERRGVLIAVDQNFRVHYPFHLAREHLHRLGAVTAIHHRDLFFRQDRGWRTTEKRHALSVMGVHWLDGIRWILDSPARTVTASTASSPAIDCTGETDASVQVLFESGVPATYIQSFSSPINVTETLILGERGALKLDYAGLSFFERPGQRPSETWENSAYAGSNKPESSFHQLNELLTAIETGAQPTNSGRDNIQTIALLEAAYQSAQQHRTVALQELSE